MHPEVTIGILTRRDALEGQGPRRRLQTRLDRRLEQVAKTVGGGYWRLQMPLKLALGVRGTLAGHRLGSWREVLFQCIPARSALRAHPPRPLLCETIFDSDGNYGKEPGRTDGKDQPTPGEESEREEVDRWEAKGRGTLGTPSSRG